MSSCGSTRISQYFDALRESRLTGDATDPRSFTEMGIVSESNPNRTYSPSNMNSVLHTQRFLII